MAFTPLNALNVFLAVARKRSFGGAAVELGVSTSAVSQSLRQLEARLGVTLVVRTTRSVSLTEAGRRLLEAAGPAVAQALEALAVASAEPGEVTGRLRLSVPRLALAAVIDPILPRFMQLHPRVEVEIAVEDRLVDLVGEGYDGGIRLTEAIERDMVQVRLTEGFRFVVVGAPAYLERKGAPARPRDLLAHDCLCYRSPTTGGLYSWELERGAKSWRIPVRGAFSTNDAVLLVAMARRALGLAYVAEIAVAAELERGALRPVLEPYAPMVPGFFLYFPSRTQLAAPLRAFIDVAKGKR